MKILFRDNQSHDSLRRRANARNASFGISLRSPIHIINPDDKTKLSCYNSHRRSTTVSLETSPSIHWRKRNPLQQSYYWTFILPLFWTVQSLYTWGISSRAVNTGNRLPRDHMVQTACHASCRNKPCIRPALRSRQHQPGWLCCSFASPCHGKGGNDLDNWSLLHLGLEF